MNGRNRKGFTLLDISIFAGVFSLTLAMMMGSMTRAREQASRVKCASNLRQLGQAMAMYANNETRNGNAFPRTNFVADAPLTQTDAGAATPSPGYNQPESFNTNGGPSPVGDNNVMASFFLLIKTQDITASVFNCPTADAVPDAFAHSVSTSATGPSGYTCWDAPANTYLSYSMQVPFPTKAATADGFRWDAAVAPDFAVMADVNPGTPALLTITPASTRQQTFAANSPNHAREGQNVAYGDFHVEWQVTPFAGATRGTGAASFADNIYTYGADSSGIGGPPQDHLDSILLPVAGQGYSASAVAGSNRNSVTTVLIGVGVAIVVIAAIVIVIVLMMRKSRTPPPLPPMPPA